MKFKVCLLAIILSLSVTNADESFEACRDQYLHSKGLIDSEFYSVDNMDMNLSNKCNDIMVQYRDLFCKNIVEAFKQNPASKEIAECIRDEMKTGNISDVLMTKMFYDESQHDKAKTFSSKMESEIQKISNYVIGGCMAGKTFDSVFTNPSNASVDEEICGRKYLLENNFWSSTDGELRAPGYVCKEVIEKMEADVTNSYISMFESLFTTDSQMQCAEEAIRSCKLFAGLMRAAAFKDIGISDEKKAEERSVFIEKSRKMTADVMKC